MIENFATLEDVFADDIFDKLVAEIKPKRNIPLDPEIEKFQEIVNWIKENGREPKLSRNLIERKLYSRLKGIRNKPSQWEKYKGYDILNLLGGGENA
ncbi:hypothetical protein [Veillonella ratti]|uniref:hypothetical protein n=1 Tax=Veillonella ratti TaxID=103892 RepID=UPI000F8D8AEE|nr:hypothetical protein [Veillonella ratti]